MSEAIVPCDIQSVDTLIISCPYSSCRQEAGPLWIITLIIWTDEQFRCIESTTNSRNLQKLIIYFLVANIPKILIYEFCFVNTDSKTRKKQKYYNVYTNMCS